MNGADERGVDLCGERRIGHPITVWYSLQVERLEREVAELIPQVVEARDTLAKVAALVIEEIALPKLGS